MPSERLEHSPQDKMPIGEPVTRPDGNIVSIHKLPDHVQFRVGSICSDYSDGSLEYLGDGNWAAGLMLVAQAFYSNPEDPLEQWGKRGPYYDQLPQSEYGSQE